MKTSVFSFWNIFCVLASLSEVIDESIISSGRHLCVRKQFFYWNSYVLTLNLLTTTIVAPPSNASKWQMGFNSAFKGLIMTPWSSCRYQLVLHFRRFMVKKRPLFNKRQLFLSGCVSLVAVVGFGCSVQVCWSLIWFISGGVSSGFYFVTGSRAVLKHKITSILLCAVLSSLQIDD